MSRSQTIQLFQGEALSAFERTPFADGGVTILFVSRRPIRKQLRNTAVDAIDKSVGEKLRRWRYDGEVTRHDGSFHLGAAYSAGSLAFARSASFSRLQSRHTSVSSLEAKYLRVGDDLKEQVLLAAMAFAATVLVPDEGMESQVAFTDVIAFTVLRRVRQRVLVNFVFDEVLKNTLHYKVRKALPRKGKKADRIAPGWVLEHYEATLEAGDAIRVG